MLEEWRFAARDAAADNEAALDAAALRYAGLLTAINAGRTALAGWLSDAGRHLTFADEGTIFFATHSLFDEAGDDDYATACESARRLIRSLRSERPHPKIVAFASSADGARAFHAALNACWTIARYC